jgi:iron complex transport system substrate-binding protein
VIPGCRERSSETVSNSTKKVAAAKITVTDDLGRKLEIPAQPKRVLGLAASMTEMLFAVVPDSMIVGRTQVCNYPEAALKKPVVSSFPMDIEGLLALKPDLVFTEDGMTSMEMAEKIQELGIPVYFQKYNKVEDVFRGLNDIGRIMHREAAAKHLTDSLQTELKAIENAPKTEKPNRVLALISPDPIYVYGQNTLMTDKIRKAGGENALQEVFKQLSPPLTREYILKLNPDVIFGFRPEQMNNTFFRLYPELKKVNAYKTGRIYELTDDLASRPSPRVVESVKEIRAFLQK